MAIKINFVLFERTFKVIYEDTFSYLAWFLKYFDQQQCAVRHLGIIRVFDDVTSRVNLLKFLHVGLSPSKSYLKCCELIEY